MESLLGEALVLYESVFGETKEIWSGIFNFAGAIYEEMVLLRP